MNSAQPPEDGPWDATRGPHQQAGDPRRAEQGEGGAAVRVLFLNSAWVSSTCAQGGKLGAPPDEANSANGHFRPCRGH